MDEEQIINYIFRSLPVAFATLGINLTHEIGHTIAAAVKKASQRGCWCEGCSRSLQLVGSVLAAATVCLSLDLLLESPQQLEAVAGARRSTTKEPHLSLPLSLHPPCRSSSVCATLSPTAH